MQIATLFQRDVTRDIAPVIYFHVKSPQALQSEVSEYIITGGYAENDPRKGRVERGIHEEYVRLLRGIVNELEDPSGSEPAAWISGFYGSGKSSFAKMLGLALDDWTLPHGDSFTEAFLARNQTAKREEFLNLWKRLHDKIDPVSVVFDIGGSAREEPIHITMLRETLSRFGYAENDRVAIWETRLERDSYYEEFTRAYADLYDESWEEEGRLKRTSDAPVSAVMHAMQPNTWDSKDSWRLWFGREKPYNLSPNEVRDTIVSVLDQRAPGKTLFLVVDEISQYVIGQNQRMLDLQSFNSAIGNEKGRIWLLATGQQKLEAQDASTELGKMKGRFPAPLRVHLGEQNIREVVHKRLLQKTPRGEQELRQLFEKNHQNLKLYAYDCAEITEEDFVEVYPLLPGHINLILDITTQIRHRSTRMQGDSHSVRGLMGLLGDLFREKDLASRPVGELVRFDDIYDIQETSLDVDRQSTMQRVRTWAEKNEAPFAFSVAKVVALLELIQEQRPTTAEFVAQCLYDRVDRGPARLDDVERALDELKHAEPVPLVSYSDPRGYRLESSARAEWNRERDEISISSEDQVSAIQKQLKELLNVPNDPKISGVPLPLEATYTDSRGAQAVALKSGRVQAVAPVSFQLLKKDERSSTAWVRKSAEEAYRNELVWVSGDIDHVFDTARRWARSYRMVRRKEPVRDSLAPENQQLLIQEKTEEETRLKHLREAVGRAFMDGAFYFRGREIEPRSQGEGFGAALEHAATSVLEEMYPHFVTLQVTSTELEQLFQPSLNGASRKFMSDHDGLGILELDAGQIVPNCKGSIPQQVLRAVREMEGISGAMIFDRFGTVPYGYAPSVIKACLLGLLRNHDIRIVQKGGTQVDSYADPGTKDLFSGERDLKAASYYGGRVGPDPRMRVVCCKFLKNEFGIEVPREDQPITDALFQNLPKRNGELSSLRTRILSLPVDVELPSPLQRLEDAIAASLASRDVMKTVNALYDNVDDLRNGLQQLKLIDVELTDEAVATLGAIRRVLDVEYAQMAAIEATTTEVDDASAELRTHLELDRPWTHVAALKPHIDTIRQAYRAERRSELEKLSQAVEDARLRIKSRDGFEKLDADQSNAVLRPFALVVPNTDAESTHPPLSLLHARRGTGLADALDEAHAVLDDIQEVVVVVRHRMSGKIIKSQADLDAALEELRKVISERLSQGKEVRLQ